MQKFTEEQKALIVSAAEKLVKCKGRYHAEQNYKSLAALFGVDVPTDDGWISVDEVIPECDGLYLTWDGKSVSTTPLIFGIWQCNQFIREKITHWQPLPSPPESQ